CHVTSMVAVRVVFAMKSNKGAVPVTCAVVSLTPNWMVPVNTGAPVVGSLLDAASNWTLLQLSKLDTNTKTDCVFTLPGCVRLSKAWMKASVKIHPSLLTLPKSAVALLLWKVQTGCGVETHPPPPVPEPSAVLARKGKRAKRAITATTAVTVT